MTSNARPRKVLEVDGSQGEGGGQILRNAISYAAILQKPIRIVKIRAGRKQPGLKAQHATSLRLAAQLTNATLTGDTVGSTVIEYTPPTSSLLTLYSQVVKGDTQTAGSICLMLQAALPCALFIRDCETILQMKGGTNASMAPQYDYWSLVFLPTLIERFDLRASEHSPLPVVSEVIRRGYFPKGGGEVHVKVTPLTRPLKSIQMTERGVVEQIYIYSFHAGKLPKHVAVDMASSAEQRLVSSKLFTCPIQTDICTESNTRDSASGIVIVATTSTGCRLAGSSLGNRNTKFQAVGQAAAQELIDTWKDGGCVDEWLQDQLILYAALAHGTSEILTGSLTLHTQTAIQVARQLTGANITIEKLDDPMNKRDNDASVEYGKEGRISGRHLIRCEGIGFCNPSKEQDKR